VVTGGRKYRQTKGGKKGVQKEVFTGVRKFVKRKNPEHGAKGGDVLRLMREGENLGGGKKDKHTLKGGGGEDASERKKAKNNGGSGF